MNLDGFRIDVLGVMTLMPEQVECRVARVLSPTGEERMVYLPRHVWTQNAMHAEVIATVFEMALAMG